MIFTQEDLFIYLFDFWLQQVHIVLHCLLTVGNLNIQKGWHPDILIVYKEEKRKKRTETELIHYHKIIPE